MIGTARILRGDQAKCWNCPATLGQVGLAGPLTNLPVGTPILAALPFYKISDPRPELPGVTILVIPDRVRDRIKRTGLPVGSRRPQRTAPGGKIARPASVIVPLPVLTECANPACGRPNRVDKAVQDS